MLVLLEKFKHGGHRTYQVAAAVVGAGVGGALISSSAAKSAANSQANAANQANATQMAQYNQTRADNAPFLANGTAASNKLSTLLGTADTSSLKGVQDIYTKLLANANNEHIQRYGIGMDESSDTKDIAAWKTQLLNQAQQQYLDAGGQEASQDPQYGSLLKSFDANDLANDPIYQSTFQNAMDSGTKGVNQQAAATGSMLSGNTLKALSRFGANTAATYGNDAYNRYNTNQSNTYNKLAGISGSGQTAVNQVSSSGQNAANNIAQNQIGVGNARGASSIASANAYGNALSTGVNAYQNQSYMNSLYPQTYGVAQQPGVTDWVSQG